MLIEWRISVLLLVVVSLGSSVLSAIHKGPNSADVKREFRFLEAFYNASVEENSLGSTMVIPTKKMGVWSPDPNQTVHFNIMGGDPLKMFRVESRQVGDFCFLIIRVNNNDRSLNREFKELYKLQMKATLHANREPEDLAGATADDPMKTVLVGNGEHDNGNGGDENSNSPLRNGGNLEIEAIEKLIPTSLKGKSLSGDQSELELSLHDQVSLPKTKLLKLETVFISEPPTESVQNDQVVRVLKKVGSRSLSSDYNEERNDAVPSRLWQNSSVLFSSRATERNLRGTKQNLNKKVKEKSMVKKSLRRSLGDERRNKSRSERRNKSGERRKNRKDKQVAASTESKTYSTLPRTLTTAVPTETVLSSQVPILETECIVFVRIIDKDDNVPVFEVPTYDIGVNEDAPVLAKVAKISAVDADVGRNQEIYYSLPEWNDHWSIDPITGVLSPVRPLVGRSRDKEKIRIRAKNRWNTLATAGSTTFVNIHIRPVNRHAPQIHINRPPQVEMRPYRVIYAVVAVRDPDDGENGVVDLEIKEGDPNGVFRVSPTSTINEFYIEMSPVVAKNLERKTDKAYNFNLTLRASDRGVPSKSSEKELQVRVADVLWSDKTSNWAIFDKDVYEVEISETAPPHSVVFRLKRPDSKVVLSISSGNEGDHFLLEEKSGVLYTAQWLDAESKSTYTLTIDSHDRRPGRILTRRSQSVAKIVVKVLDANDNDPVFDSLSANTSEIFLLENEPVGTKVAKISARDRDQGENGYVTYNIANLKPTPFSVDHFTGEIKTKEVLDFEQSRWQYTLRIRASDWGQPSRRESQKTIRVILQNTNDNRPLFTVSGCIAVIDRNIKFETEFGRLEAIDFDRNDVVMYRIVGGNEDGCFGLDSLSGKMRVMCDLRDLRVSKRYINVTATDSEYYSDVMTVKVELRDGLRNNFNKSDTIKTGIVLFSTSQSVFECQDTGVQERFDRMSALSEENNKIDEIDLGEKGFAPLPSRYGENIHTPQFVDFPIEITVNESCEVGSSVLKLKGRDLDKGYNGLLTFVISSGDEAHGAWDIINLETGTVAGGVTQEANLVLAVPLDREDISSYILNISVWDQGKPPKHMSKLLSIKVRDSNDCAPRFTKSAMKIKFGEGDELVGETLLQVSAFDDDEEGTPNSAVSYRLLNESPEFSIDEKTGVIRLMSELDRERQDLYELLVVAEDNGSPKLSSIALVSIVVDDKNDNAPTFESFGPGKAQISKIREDWPVGGVVTRVFAKDEDLGAAGMVRYSLVGGGRGDFSFDEISGVLRVRRELDYEKTSIYNLTIRARDYGTPSLSSETFVVVEIFDVVESSPSITFPDIVSNATIPEDSPIGTIVTSVTLNSVADSHSPEVIFSLEGESRFYFTIDSSGVVRTVHLLDHERQQSHWLTVVARSALNSKNTVRQELYIQVLDINDCTPLTDEPIYTTEISENSKPGILVVSLQAFDCDNNGGFRFAMRTSTPFFVMNAHTGEIRTSEIPLDRERHSEHTLDVIVFDQGIPPLNSTTKVVIKVKDENDCSPTFLNSGNVDNIPEFGVELQGDEPIDDENLLYSENEELDDALKWSDWNVMDESESEALVQGWRKLYRVVAFDGDAGENGTVRYRLKYLVSTNGDSSRESDSYTIHVHSGEIFTSATTIKADSMLKFIIEAKDGGNPNLATETTLMLRVKAVNKRVSRKPVILLAPEQAVSLTTKEKPGYTVETIDAMDPDGDLLWYEIISGDPLQYFIINPESQNLILAKPVPNGQVFRLNVSVSDGTNVVFTQLLVTVIESERISSMIWEQQNYTAYIRESIGDFSHVSTVKINASLSTDWTDSSTPILYGFHNAQDSRTLKLFVIDTLTGEVSVAKSGLIDREIIAQHIITVKARDPIQVYSFVRLTIVVIDINDHHPMFPSDSTGLRTDVKIPETTAVGTFIAQIEAFDIDLGENGRLTYSITFGNIGNTFGIEKETGWLHLNRALSLPFGETSVEYQLTVAATDNGSPTPLSSTTNVNVIVTLASDEEMLAIRCVGDDDRKNNNGNEMRARVKENSAPGTYVTTVRVVNSGSVSFEIENNRNNMFWIDPNMGVILVGKNKGLLDREIRSTHEMTVRATNSRGIWASCRVIVDILDENDHKPIFSSVYYEGQIREDAHLGTLVMQSDSSKSPEKKPLVLESSDADLGTNAFVTYSIIEDEEMRTVFHIDPSTGALQLVTALDYEKKSSYVFHVRAIDGGGLVSPNVATVNVTVDNINDCKPVVQSARVELITPTARGVLVYIVEARDGDGDSLEFNITRGNVQGYFEINKTSGEIRIGRAENFSGTKHVLEVSVSDGRFATLATITIHVKQLERNPLFGFRNETFRIAAVENSTKVTNLLSLSMLGDHINENLRFAILNPTEYFGIMRTSGVIFTTGKKLDREEEPYHYLLVEVRGDEGSRVARCFVEVTVVDVNDNCPLWMNLPYVAVIWVDSKPGAFVIQVKAYDADEGENAMIRYELVRSPYGDIYDLNRQTGEILLRRKPDAVGSHEITIKAYDGGVPTCTTSISVKIKINTEDQPVFAQQWYETWIPEDAGMDSTALALVAHANNPILYSIEAGNDNDEFGIDYQTDMGLNRMCVLFVNSPLDFETQSSYRLTIRATDLVSSSWSSTTVNVRIRDSNDCRPIFSKTTYHIRLTEGYIPPHGVVAVLKAHDNDTGINAMLTYELVPDDMTSRRERERGRRVLRNAHSLSEMETTMMMNEDATSNNKTSDVARFFMIKPNDGSLILKQMLDYEQAHEFRFSVVVKDSGIPPQSSTARVVFEVTDINDNAPVWEKSAYTASISELAPRGHFVAKVSAYDPDVMDSLRYAIVAHSHERAAFEIDEKSGTVILSQPSVLFLRLNFTLNISVTDGVFTSYTRLYIDVETRNHHVPKFSSLIYEVACPENSPDGYLVTRLSAEDPDRAQYGKVKYSIADSDEPDLFIMEENTGEVRVVSTPDISLDREYKASYTLDIVAQDGGGWLAYTKLVIKISDKNEYAPQFPVSEYRATVPAERINLKNPILQVVAIDADAEFGIRYSIVDLPNGNVSVKRDSYYFDMNGETGELRLKISNEDIAKLSKDRVDFQFWAVATDEGGLHSHVPVTVVLLPEGHPTPEIHPQNSTFFIKEDAPLGSVVTTFRVTNIESPRFRVVSSNDDFFQVDHEGNLLVKARLYQEEEDKHTVVIWAESADEMSVATSQVTVRVFQPKGRKHPPVFNSLHYNIKVAEDFPEGSLVFTVHVLDTDKSGNTKERYSLIPSNPSSDVLHFSVNQDHGWITLVNKLDYEMNSVHTLHVMAADSEKPYLMSTATVVVEVLNVNDSPVTFDTGHYFASVREDTNEGNLVATVQTTDLDHGKVNGSAITPSYLSYYIVAGNEKGHFKINERGEILVWKQLDYEVDQKFQLRVVTTDGFYTDYANMTVSIIDVDDNFPVCPTPEYEARLTESAVIGTYVTKIDAHDPDLSASTPFFSLTGTGVQDFQIHSDTGVITTKGRLDREAKAASYILTAHAKDKNSEQECTTTVRISIDDENDNAPKFTEEAYRVLVKEDAPVGALIGKVHADDQDVGVNRRVRYSLISVVALTDTQIDDQFGIDMTNGVISLLRPLDRELISSYNLTIQATDGGVPPQSAVTKMFIDLLDINDNPPVFSFTYYFSSISELAPISSEVTRVLATSKDIGVNAEITYDIVGGNGYSHFAIHPKTGLILVNASLDYERVREYVLAIRARDGGQPPLAAQCLVNISLQDANDNTPTFSMDSYSVQVGEDASLGMSVIQIVAADLDSGSNSIVTYHLGNGDRMKQFQIDPSRGVITVASALDREMISHYSLDVWATDQGSPPLSASTTVEVTILDINDNAPLLMQPDGVLIVQEDRPVGFVIYRFEVSDADAPPNSKPFSWDLRDLDSLKGTSLPFTISETGTLNVAGKLNFQRKNLYQLQVRVFDNGDPPLFSDVNVTIKVVDKSQWPPVVSTLTVTAITCDETYPAGIPLGKVHASDFDPYDTLVYSLLETQSSAYFTIDSSNGTLKSLTPLREGNYELGIGVSDGRWTARGDAYVKIVTLVSLIPDVKLDHVYLAEGKDGKMGKIHSNAKSRKDISSFAVVMTLRGHNPHSLLTRIFALINTVKEAMGVEHNGVSIYEVVVLSVQSSKTSSSQVSTTTRTKREGDVPSVDILLAVRKSTDGSFVPPSELVKKLRFALPQIESVLSAKVSRLTYDVCKEDSCDRGQCRTVATFEGTQSLITTETLSLITPNHYLETICICPPGYGGSRCEKVINACAHSECMQGYVCVPDSSAKGYACLCRKTYCPPGVACEEEDHCAQQSMSFSGTSFLAYNVGPTLERELSISLRIKTLYTSGTLLHTFGHFDYAVLEIRQGLVQFSWDLGTGKEVLTVTSISVSDNRWHRVVLQLRDNYAILRVNERSTQRQKSQGPARSLHTGGIMYIGAKIIGVPGSTLESLIPSQGFIGCMKDLRYGYTIENSNDKKTTDLYIQEVKHYITPAINTDLNPVIEEEEEETFEHDPRNSRMPPLPLHTDDKDKSGSHLLWSRNISFSCERIMHVVEACRSQPCFNGGSCSEDRTANGYKCICPSRFHGLNCEIDLDPCGSSPCLNGGKCTPTTPTGISFSPSLVAGGDFQDTQFYCHCMDGTFGVRCERGRWCKNSDGLGESEVCRHHGECEDGPVGPICWCSGGYTGATCQLDINECERGDACGAGSTCVNFQGGFRCLCPSNATGLRCNRLLTTPSIVASDYQELILIVVVIFCFIILLIVFIFVRRCFIARERNAASNAIPLSSSQIKDKDNRIPIGRDNREQMMRNRDSKISNLEVRPVSATSDIFSTDVRSPLDPIKSYGSAGDDLEKPPFINNLMKGSIDKKRLAGQASWETNRDDYPKMQNYIKGEINWASKGSKPSSHTSTDASSGYQWDHIDLTQPANISPTRTLPPPPDIPDSVSLVSHDSNTEITTINLAALPPIDSGRDMDTLVEEEDPEGALSYLDEGTSCDEGVWPIPHPDQYLLPHRISEGTDTTDQEESTKPLALRNRYRNKSSFHNFNEANTSQISEISDDEINENSHLLSPSGLLPEPHLMSVAASSRPSSESKMKNVLSHSPQSSGTNSQSPQKLFQPPTFSSSTFNPNSNSNSNNPSRKNYSKTTHITQV